ncbi:MAG: hypothetical protein ACKOET_03405, partial [Verrucomicrobiota bacterium]
MIPRFFRARSAWTALALGWLGYASARADWSWIWADGPGSEAGAQLRREFEVSGDVREARLLVTCDNRARVFLDGEMVLTNPDWNEPA